MPKSRKKRRSRKRVLALPDLEQSKTAVLNSLTSRSGQRNFDRAVISTCVGMRPQGVSHATVNDEKEIRERTATASTRFQGEITRCFLLRNGNVDKLEPRKSAPNSCAPDI